MSVDEVRELIKECVYECLQNVPPSTNSNSRANQADIGGIDMAVEVTGLKKPTLYALTQRREIPYYKKCKRLYFRRSELEAWIISGRVATTADILAMADLLVIGRGKRKAKS